MIKKSDVLKGIIVCLVFLVLTSFIFIFKGGFTGFAVFESLGTGFNNGVHYNTTYNGSSLVLRGTNLTGAYFSEIFDAGNDARWNNLSWIGSMPQLEILFATDTSADVWSSGNGITWALVKDDYNGVAGNNVDGIAKDSLKNLYLLDLQDLWKSSDNWVTWTKVNDDFNGGSDSNAGKSITIDSSNNIFVIDGSEDVFKSTDSGTSFSLLASDFNGANGITSALIANSSNSLFAVDNQADVWQSLNSGVTWTLVKDDYNNGAANGVDGIARNSTNSLFILDNQDIWTSNNGGVTWTKVNDDFNGGSDSNAGKSITIDSSNNIFVIDGSEDVFKSTDSGTSFSLLASDFNGANGITSALTSMILQTNLTYQIKNCSQSNCGDGNWQTVNLSNINLTGRYLQYKVIFTSPDSSISPSLRNVSIDYNILNTAPSLRIIFPLNSGIYGFNNSISLNFSASDSDNNLQGCWYNVNNGNNISLTNCQNTSFRIAGNGSYVLDLYANDSFNLINTSTVSFNVINSAPTVVIVSPESGASYGYNQSISLNFTASDINNDLQSCWYNVNNGNNISLTNCQNTSFNVSGNGDYLIKVYANDSYGLESSYNANFTVQVGAPSITIHFPYDVYLANKRVEFNYTPSDIDLRSCKLWGNFDGIFKLNQTNNSLLNGQINHFYLNLSDGNYLWNIECNDSIGHSSFNGNKSFYVDTTDPILSINEPSGVKTGRTGIALDFSISDASPLNCSYNITTSVGTPIVSNVKIDNCLNTTFNVASDGDYIIYLRTEDIVLHSKSVNSNFSVDSSETTSPGGGDSGGSSGGGSDVASVLKKLEPKIEVSKIGEVIINEGDKKTLSLNVKNTGTRFLNKCRLKASGEISSWIYSTQNEGIAPGENINFAVDINVPEGIELKDYSGDLIVECEEISDSQPVKFIFPKSLQTINIKDLKQEKEGLNISYSFDNSNFVGNDVGIEIWIVDKDGVEINRIVDNFPINKEGLIERNILIKIPAVSAGIYDVYFAISSDKDNFIKKTVVLGKTSSTGFAILGEGGAKILSYVVLILVIGVGSFFILRRYIERKNIKDSGKLKKPSRFDSSKEHWFFGE